MAIILESIDDSKNEETYTVREKILLHELRTLLKDTDEFKRTLNTLVESDRGERWSDQQLIVYLNQAIADINAEPAHTVYDLNNFPEAWKSCVVIGGLVFALIAESILQAGESFSYSDNGISLNIDLSGKYQSLAQMMLQGYVQTKQSIKRAMRPSAASIKTGDQNNVKIRSYAPRMWTYR